jgi:hypothetical protein
MALTAEAAATSRSFAAPVTDRPSIHHCLLCHLILLLLPDLNGHLLRHEIRTRLLLIPIPAPALAAVQTLVDL